MLISRISSRSVERNRAELRSSVKRLSLIADEERQANITAAQAEELRKLIVSTYLSDRFESLLDPLVEETQRRFDERFREWFGCLSRLGRR